MGIVGQIKRVTGNDKAGQRVLAGIFANLAGKIWVLLVQLSAIPILTQHWGASGYGSWLMISTIPTYVALSNVGLGAAAGLEITREVSDGEYQKARCVFQSIWTLVTIILLAIVLLAGAIWALMYEWRPDLIPSLAPAMFLMILYAVGIVQMSLLNVVFRATKKYAIGTALNDLMVPIEGCALIATALLGGKLFDAALAVCVLRWCGWAAYYRILRHSEPWAGLGWRDASRGVIRRLAMPSLAALSLTLSDSLGIQAVVLTLGWSTAPAVVAVFASTRFLSRMPLQFAGLVTRASIPELSRALVVGNHALINRLLRVNILTTVAVVGPFLAVLFFEGPFLLGHLSKHNLIAPQYLFVLLGLASAANALWNAMSSPLLAANRQTEYAPIYFILCTAVMLVPLFHWHSLLLTAAASMTAECVMMIFVGIRLYYYRNNSWFTRQS